MRKTTILLSIVAMFFAGCTVSREARIDRIQSAHPQWDRSTVERVAAGRVETGMTEEMVEAIIGKPWQIGREGDKLLWTYAAYTTGAWGEPRPVPAFFVYFTDGRVASTRGDQRRVVTPLE